MMYHIFLHIISYYIFLFPTILFGEIYFTRKDFSNTYETTIPQTKYMEKIDIFDPRFYLNSLVRINTNFMIGTTQKVIYLNYPFTFTNNTVNNTMKNTNSAGIIILTDQPEHVTTENLASQTSIVPIAYLVLQDIPIGWSLYTPADYYQNVKEVTNLSLYNNNMYIGRKCGPQHKYSDFNGNLAVVFNSSGEYNITLGNNSGNYNNAKLLSYNTIVGNMSGNLLTGSFNSFFGNYHSAKTILNPNYFNQDYYSNNDYSNYNNSFGFGNYNLTHSTGQGLKFLANKQNNIFGNLNFSSIWRGYRNCIFGNRILTTIIDNITQFNWIDSNIMIGNNILYQYNNNLLTGLYGNIMLVPNGDQSIYGGIDVSLAFAPYNTSNTPSPTNYTIMIGSCGLPIAYNRSYKTFIANIYNSSLIDSGVPVIANTDTLGTINKTSFPLVVLINNADQLGQMQLVPYGDPYNYNPNNQPGNVTNLTAIVNDLLNPETLPVIGVAFENTTEATDKGLLFTVDTYALIKNSGTQKSNPLSAYTIYTAKKSPLPYSNSNSPNTSNAVNNAITSDLQIAGYEHYYLIPVLVSACQTLNQKIITMIEQIKILNNNYIIEQNELANCKEKIKLLLKQQEVILRKLRKKNSRK
jgi:hypothetical protein